MNNLIPNVIQLGWGGDNGWGTSIVQTIYMTFWPAIFGGILGLIFGVALVVTEPGGILENRIVFSIVDKVVSVFRAIPFIILLAFIAPFTQLIVGTQIGTTAALVPLSLGVFAFYARQVQVALESVDHGKIEAAQAIGATNWAMAGAIGAGGLGNTAISYGYDRFNNDVTLVATILVLLFVLIIQVVGDILAKKLNHQDR